MSRISLMLTCSREQWANRGCTKKLRTHPQQKETPERTCVLSCLRSFLSGSVPVSRPDDLLSDGRRLLQLLPDARREFLFERKCTDLRKCSALCVLLLLSVLQAVCCSDHLHCCPTGTRCDLALSMCVRGPEGPSPAIKITAALVAEPLAPKSSGQTAVSCCCAVI